ncbi:MAG: DUF5667 domain-containing protein [Aggregatilineaceae bacterium]
MGHEEERDLWALLERLDRAIPPGTHAIGNADDDPLVEAARRLAQGPTVRLTPAAQARIEARLRAHMTAQAGSPARRNPFRQRLSPLLRAAAVLAIVLVLGLFGMAQASADSLPGDRLYPVKRAIEDARLTLVSAQSEPALRLEFAARRLDEFERLLASRQVYPSALFQASAHLDRALDLLAAGHGDRARLDEQIASLTRQQTGLIARAEALATFDEYQQLGAAQRRNLAVQERLAEEGGVPDFRPDYTPTPTPTEIPTPTPTATATPSPTASATPSPTATATPTLTATATIMPGGTLTGTPDQGRPKAGTPTRTPPGHGPTPGLGDNPPGQGGPHPGVGNSGQPPGQDKPKSKP